MERPCSHCAAAPSMRLLRRWKHSAMNAPGCSRASKALGRSWMSIFLPCSKFFLISFPYLCMSQTQTIVIERIFDAPREKVWKAWTEPEHIKHWWGPKDFTAPHAKNDLHVGGKYLY